MYKFINAAIRFLVPLFVVLALTGAPISVHADGEIVDIFNRPVERANGTSSDGAARLAAPPEQKAGQVEAELLPTTLFKPYVTYAMTSAWADGAGIGDFNSDGLQDVAVSDSSNGTGLWIFLQQSNGSLAFSTKYPTGSRPETLTVGDFNNDGRDDVVTADFGNNAISVYLQTSAGKLAQRVTYASSTGPDALAAADLNNDGLLDLAVSHWNAAYLGVFFQQVDGKLGTMVRYESPRAGYDDIDTGDFNHDGLTDIVKMNGQGINPNLSVYLQIPGGFASPVSYKAASTNASGMAAGDLTGDGWDDIAVAYGGNSAKITIFAQNAAGVLEQQTTYPAYDIPEPMEIADVNLDGRLDLLAVHAGWNALSVFYQQEDGSLAPYQRSTLPYASHYSPQGFDIGDINQDGFPDAVIGDYNHGLVVLHNALAPDFQISASPNNPAVLAGQTAQLTVNLGAINNFNGPITLAVSGLASTISAAFADNPANGPGATTLLLSVDPSAAVGSDAFTITGTSGNLSHTISAAVHVIQAVAGLTATNSGPVQLGTAVQLQASVSAGSGVVYTWDFGDGSPVKEGSAPTVSYTYKSVGQFIATVVARNEVSSALATVTVEVQDVPIANLNATGSSRTLLGSAAQFQAFTSAGSNVVYTWDFGDGLTGSGKSAAHTYEQIGQYTVTVTAQNGTSSEQTSLVAEVVDVPISGLNVYSSASDQIEGLVVFSAFISNGTNVQYLWDFGDNLSASGPVVLHIFPTRGIFTIRLTVTNGQGSQTKTLVVNTNTKNLQYIYLPAIMTNQ